jgi:hypothetical protein
MMQTRIKSDVVKLDLPKVAHQKNAELLFATFLSR